MQPDQSYAILIGQQHVMHCISKNSGICCKISLQGKKVAVVGHVQAGSYTNRDGRKIYTTEIITDEIEFAESKKDVDVHVDVDKSGCISIPDDIDEKLPI